MEKKNIIKLLLVAVAIVGLIYLIVDQFNKVGTSEGSIDYYNLSGDIRASIDSLSSSWNSSSYNAFRELLSDIDIASGMNAIDKTAADNNLASTREVFDLASNSYFTHISWDETDLSHIKHIAGYLQDKGILGIVDGYYGAKSVIANSKSCTSQSAVDNCISKAESYNKAPWINCKEIKDGLASVKMNALESYTNRSLIPLCNRLMNYKSNYQYFDEFDADYQKATSGKEYLQKKSHVSSSFNSKYSSIDYNSAANDLDPRF